MSTEHQVRASIGFAGGLVLAIRVSADALGKLRDALAGERRIYDLELEDGSVAVDLSQVAYLRVESDEPRVGFGT
jgi:hypothetical protein